MTHEGFGKFLVPFTNINISCSCRFVKYIYIYIYIYFTCLDFDVIGKYMPLDPHLKCPFLLGTTH